MAWPTSERFLRAVRQSHDVVIRAEVWRDGVLLLPDLAVVGGDLSVDEGSKVRRTVTLRIADDALMPAEADDLLAPFGTEVAVFYGLRMTEGDVEEVPAIVARVSAVEHEGWHGGLTIRGADRSSAVQEARFLRPENTAAGALVTAEIARLVTDALPDVEVYDLTNSTATTTASVWERDRWDAILTLGDSIGAEVFFDPAGRCIIRPVPEISETSEAVWAVDAETDDASLLDVSTVLSSEGVYNAVVAQGEAQDNVPAIVAVSRLTTGPLAWGAFRKPRFFTSKFLRTYEQAAAASRAILARSTALAREVSPDALPNPALDVGDVVTVDLPSGDSSPRIVSSIRLPLEAGGMSLGARVNEPFAVSSDVGSLD